MNVTEFTKIWHQLNEAQCEVISAREAKTPEVERARLRKALVEVRKGEKEILRVLGAAEGS